MSLTADQLYALLPALYRTRDAQNGGPLQALLSVVAAQLGVIQENVRQLYDDEFIETCAPWVIPYIGDLVGSNTIYEISGVSSGLRAEVANTIGYRRRKGTLLALEQVAMDVSGRPAAAVEFFKRLVTTESMRRVRPHHAATVDLRRGGALDRMNSAFDTLNRMVDVRRIAPRIRPILDPAPSPLAIDLHGGGRYNVPDVGAYLWRWKSRPMTNAPAFKVDDRRYMISPLGQNMPLFNQLPPRDSFSRLTARLDVPQPIRRRELYDSLRTGAVDFYGPGASIELVADGAPIDISRICCRDLSEGPGQSWGCAPSGKVAIDPVLGRVALANDLPVPRQLRVNYSYGFPADIGGGPYDRSASLSLPDLSRFTFIAVVGASATPTLEDAVAGWNHMVPGSTGLIVLPDCESFDVNLTGSAAVLLPSESKLWILAAQVHAMARDPFSYDVSCVTLRGDVEIRGRQVPAASGGDVLPVGQLTLSGVWISGSVQIAAAATNVQLMDCTLVPGLTLARDGTPRHASEPSIVAAALGVNLSLVRCISGPIGSAPGGTVRVCSSIVDSGSRCGVAYAGADLASGGADLHIEDSTVIGKVWVRTMRLASNTIFLARRARHDPWDAAVWCGRRQAGCMRFCFVPSDAITPQRFRCLPGDPGQEGALEPHFVTLQYGHPSYGLLSGDVPMAIWSGADNGSQMGAYHLLQETEAVRNAQVRVPEYLPFGLEAGIVLEPSQVVVFPRVAVEYRYGARTAVDACGDPEAEELQYLGIGAILI